MQKIIRQAVPAILLLSVLQSCSRGAMESAPVQGTEKAAVTADSATQSLPIEDINSPLRKLVRTADIRCRVKDVFAATEVLERQVTAMGGQIAESSMENEQSEMTELPYKTDSLKQVKSYISVANLTLRVPTKMLDSVLNTVPQLSQFIESRHLRQDDMTYGYQANEMKNESMNRVDKAISKAKKTDEVLSAATYESSQREAAIDRKMENLEIQDQVNYSTLKVALYQPQNVDVLVVINPQAFKSSNLGYSLLRALHTGLEIMKGIIVCLVTIWPLYVIGFVIFLLYRQFKGKRVIS